MDIHNRNLRLILLVCLVVQEAWTDAPPSADYCMRNATPTNLTAGQGAYFTKDTASTTVTESDLKVICVIYTAPPGTKFVVTPILINLDRNSLIINGKQSWRSDGLPQEITVSKPSEITAYELNSNSLTLSMISNISNIDSQIFQVEVKVIGCAYEDILLHRSKPIITANGSMTSVQDHHGLILSVPDYNASTKSYTAQVSCCSGRILPNGQDNGINICNNVNYQWDIANLTCKGTCPTPSKPDHGKILSIVRGDHGELKKVEFGCNDGYVLKGTATSTCAVLEQLCQFNPVWGTTTPTCEQSELGSKVIPAASQTMSHIAPHTASHIATHNTSRTRSHTTPHATMTSSPSSSPDVLTATASDTDKAAVVSGATVAQDNTGKSMPLILGLAIGIPCFVGIIVLSIACCKHKQSSQGRRREKSPGADSEPKSMIDPSLPSPRQTAVHKNTPTIIVARDSTYYVNHSASPTQPRKPVVTTQVYQNSAFNSSVYYETPDNIQIEGDRELDYGLSASYAELEASCALGLSHTYADMGNLTIQAARPQAAEAEKGFFLTSDSYGVLNPNARLRVSTHYANTSNRDSNQESYEVLEKSSTSHIYSAPN